MLFVTFLRLPFTLYEEALRKKYISNMFYIYAHSGYCPFSSNLLKYFIPASFENLLF